MTTSASDFHLLYSANPNLRHIATLNYKTAMARGQRGGIIRTPVVHPMFHRPSDDVFRFPQDYIKSQRGYGKGGSVRVYPVGKRWNRNPRQFGAGQKGGLAAGAIGKMLLKPALGVALPMAAKYGINKIGKLIKKRKKQRGGNIRALASQLVESPQFTNLLTDPLMHVTRMARQYGSEGIKSLQTKLAGAIRGSQKGGSMKRRLAGDGKMLAGNLIRNAAELLNQKPTQQFVKSTVRKKVPIFKNTISKKAWGAVNSALRKASREGEKMWTSGRKQQRGGAFGVAAMLGKAILPTVAGAVLEPLLGGVLKQVGLGKGKGKGSHALRRVKRVTALNKRLRAALQRGGRGNAGDDVETNAVIQQVLHNKTPSGKATSTSVPTSKKKRSKSDILWSVVNSNAATQFANKFGQKASDAVLTKIFG